MKGESLGDVLAPITASFFSLPPDLVTTEEATRFLNSVRAADPQRDLLVLTDPPLGDHLAKTRAEAGWERFHVLPAWGIPYSIWPRDPLTLLHDDEGTIAVLRPNAQSTREADLYLGRALVQTLPESLDVDLGGLRWRTSETSFHNGQVLFADGAAWISLHSLEPRILELLGIDRIPVEDFAADAGREFLAAARAAASDLEELYGRPVRWVHDLPTLDAPPETRGASLRGLGGGAGFDLDSLATLLEGDEGITALVADPRLGGELMRSLSADELLDFRRTWSLRGDEPSLRRALLAAQETPRARALSAFLDRIAVHLGSQEGSQNSSKTGPQMRVIRLPLLLVPQAFLQDPPGGAEDFLLGWNNVVLQGGAADRGPTAEGFASGLPSGDAFAREAFASEGLELLLHPPLVSSVVRGGGYRCASQHLRLRFPPLKKGG